MGIRTRLPYSSHMKSTSTTRTWRWWLGLVCKQKWILVGALSCMLVFLLGEALMPWVVGLVIDHILIESVIESNQVSLPLFGIVTPTQALLTVLGLGVALVFIRNVAQYGRDALFNEVGERVHLDLRQHLFDHLQKLPLSFFDKSYTGRIMARITTDADALYHILCQGTINIIGHAILITGMSISLYFIHGGLALTLFGCAPVLLVLVGITRKRAREAGRNQREALGNIYSRLQERISGIRVIRSFGRSAEESQAFHEDLLELYTHNRKLVRGYSKLGAMSNACTRTTGMLLLCLGGIAVVRGSITPGQLVTFYLASAIVLNPLSAMAHAITQYITDAGVAIERIGEILDMQTGDEEEANKTPAPVLEGDITLTDVTFSYIPGQSVIENFSVHAKAGTCIALVGPSGAGKSTLVDLLCRFYKPDCGTILVDGHNIHDLAPNSYRKQIGYVSQDTFLFRGTIADNLRIAKQDATDAEIRAACEKANALEFINNLSDGLETIVGERGITLSGGQRQRLGIARTLLSDPKLLILDEPTSALDAESEAVVMDAIKRCFAGRSCVIIAHRLSTVRHADCIYVMNRGKIVEQGAHADLIAQAGLYTELATKQGLV